MKRREKLKNGKNIQTQQKGIKSFSSHPGCHSHTLRGFFYIFPDIIYEFLGYTYQIYIGCFKHEIYEIIWHILLCSFSKIKILYIRFSILIQTYYLLLHNCSIFSVTFIITKTKRLEKSLNVHGSRCPNTSKIYCNKGIIIFPTNSRKLITGKIKAKLIDIGIIKANTNFNGRLVHKRKV